MIPVDRKNMVFSHEEFESEIRFSILGPRESKLKTCLTLKDTVKYQVKSDKATYHWTCTANLGSWAYFWLEDSVQKVDVLGRIDSDNMNVKRHMVGSI